MPIAAIYGPDDFANPGHGYSAPPRSRATLAEPARALPMPSLEWTPEVERATAHLYERVKKVIAPVEWPLMAPYIKAINELKQTRGAVILAHNYQTPEIFHCVADIRGDSLQLAIEATKVKSDIIVQCGVHFMAETSKIAHPECPPDVLAEADFTGSTAHMINWVRSNRPKRVVMITECSMADNVQAEMPDLEMVRPCNLCPHMKRITLPKILDSLVYLREEVTIDPLIAEKARRSVQRMINLKN